MILFLVLWIIVHTSPIAAKTNLTYPEDFLFGIATSAYQTEGAWNASEKSESIWDHFVHTHPEKIKNHDSGDVADDEYHQYIKDTSMACSLGITHYGFSVSWTRLLPAGIGENIDVPGANFYIDVVRQLTGEHVTPMVTLYQGDLPQSLQDLGGWTNPDMVEYFTNYARVAIKYVAMIGKVGYWITFNNPHQICRDGYGTGEFAPGVEMDGIADYMCAYVVLKAHAAAYHMYKTEYPSLQGKMSMAINGEWYEPATNSTEDQDAAERLRQFEFGMFGNPLLKGNWPQVIIDRVNERSAKENYTRSRLPPFTDEEIAFIKGTYDFVALNTFETRLVADAKEQPYSETSYDNDVRVDVTVDPSWPQSVDGKTSVPWGVRKILLWLKSTYNNPHIFITANGVSDDGTMEDSGRVQYHTDYLTYILEALYVDQVRVFGYTLWSLLDSFEWSEGYSPHYGVLHINPDDIYQSRTWKSSYYFYEGVAKSKKIPAGPSTTPEPTTVISSSTESSESTTDDSTASTSFSVTTEHSTTPSSVYRVVSSRIFVFVILTVIFLFH